MPDRPRVAVLMGSASDEPKVTPAVEILDEFLVRHEVRVLSAHRTPDDVVEFARSARGRGLAVIIAAAGKAAHLAGTVAAHTTLPVIGIPIASGGLGGLDALLSTVQMPSGVPVATVGIDGAKNAALLAVAVLGLTDPDLAAALEDYRDSFTGDRSR